MIPGAFQANALSLAAWVSQCEIEKGVEDFLEKLDNAAKRMAYLSEELRKFARRTYG